MRSITLMLLLGASASGALYADDEAAEQPGDLRIRLVPGDTVSYTQTIEWEHEQRAKRKKAGSSGVTHHDWKLTVQEPTKDQDLADGEVVVEIEMGRAWGHFESTRDPRVDFDTDVEPMPDDPNRAPIAAPVRTGEIVTATLRPDGTFQEIVDLLATQAAVVGPSPDPEPYTEFAQDFGGRQSLRELALLLPSLPARPIPGGAYYEDAGFFGAPGYFDFRVDRRNELARRNPTVAVVKCTGRIRDLTAPPRMTSRKKKNRRANREIAKGTFASSASVRRSDGLPDEVNARLHLLLKVSFGDDGDGTQSSEWTMTLTRREPPVEDPVEQPATDE